MKKVFYYFMAAMLLGACAKDDNNLTEIEKIKLSMSSTNLSAEDILKSAEYWQSAKEIYYSEPNGNGKEYIMDRTNLTGGSVYTYLQVEDNTLKQYHNAYMIGVGSYAPQKILKRYLMSNRASNEWELTHYTGAKFYFNILAYDDNKILVSTNLWQMTNNQGTFAHSIVLFTKQNFRPEWFDKCIDEEEYLNTHKE